MIVELQNADVEMTFRRCVFTKNKGADGIFMPTVYGNLDLQFQQCIFRENLTNYLLYDLTDALVSRYGFVNCLFIIIPDRSFFIPRVLLPIPNSICPIVSSCRMTMCRP